MKVATRVLQILAQVERDHSIRPGAWNDSPHHEQARSEFAQRLKWKLPESSEEQRAGWVDATRGPVGPELSADPDGANGPPP